MIKGSWFTGGTLEFDVDTEIDLTDADSVGWLVRFPDESVIEYTGEVVDISKIRARIPDTDNTQAGEIRIQATATFSGSVQNPGETETVWIQAAYAVTP